MTSPDPATERRDVVAAVRAFALATESFRIAVANYFGVGVRETEAVSHLRSRGPMSAAELGESLHLTTSAVSNLLDRLERSGLATRELHPTDRRVTIVALTDRAEQLSNTESVWIDQCLDALDDERVAADVLTTLAAEVRQRTDEIGAITDLQRQRHRSTGR